MHIIEVQINLQSDQHENVITFTDLHGRETPNTCSSLTDCCSFSHSSDFPAAISSSICISAFFFCRNLADARQLRFLLSVTPPSSLSGLVIYRGWVVEG